MTNPAMQLVVSVSGSTNSVRAELWGKRKGMWTILESRGFRDFPARYVQTMIAQYTPGSVLVRSVR